jgi:hypothetical protein
MLRIQRPLQRVVKDVYLQDDISWRKSKLPVLHWLSIHWLSIDRCELQAILTA